MRPNTPIAPGPDGKDGVGGERFRSPSGKSVCTVVKERDAGEALRVARYPYVSVSVGREAGNASKPPPEALALAERSSFPARPR